MQSTPTSQPHANLPCEPGSSGVANQSGDVANTPIEMGRRDSPRVAYAHLEWVAPWTDGRMPARDKFEEVCCRDISTSGFSYFSAVVPKSKKVVVALGSQSLLKGVVAEVIHVLPVENGGKKLYAIGCKYTNRVVY
jgi:hypothetical protein